MTRVTNPGTRGVFVSGHGVVQPGATENVKDSKALRDTIKAGQLEKASKSDNNEEEE
jgi:hypothetical protein